MSKSKDNQCEADRTGPYSGTKIGILLDDMLNNRNRRIQKSPLMRITQKIHFGHGPLSNGDILKIAQCKKIQIRINSTSLIQ
jgi:hypothetical protein